MQIGGYFVWKIIYKIKMGVENSRSVLDCQILVS